MAVTPEKRALLYVTPKNVFVKGTENTLRRDDYWNVASDAEWLEIIETQEKLAIAAISTRVNLKALKDDEAENEGVIEALCVLHIRKEMYGAIGHVELFSEQATKALEDYTRSLEVIRDNQLKAGIIADEKQLGKKAKILIF